MTCEPHFLNSLLPFQGVFAERSLHKETLVGSAFVCLGSPMLQHNKPDGHLTQIVPKYGVVKKVQRGAG